MYEEFAEIYDRMQEIDYNSFCDYYMQVFKKQGIEPKLVLDLGCGTGNITVPLAKAGMDMIGVDLSREMLAIATEKAREEKLDILFLEQDMTEFELYGTVDAVVCALDGVNYLTEDGDLDKLFALVHNYLNPNGVFVFDVNTEYKFRNILDGNTFVYDSGDAYCVWESDYIEDEKICVFNLDFFIQDRDGKYIKHQEYHNERAYSAEEIVASAERASFKVAGIYNDRSFAEAADASERIFYILKKE